MPSSSPHSFSAAFLKRSDGARPNCTVIPLLFIADRRRHDSRSVASVQFLIDRKTTTSDHAPRLGVYRAMSAMADLQLRRLGGGETPGARRPLCKENPSWPAI